MIPRNWRPVFGQDHPQSRSRLTPCATPPPNSIFLCCRAWAIPASITGNPIGVWHFVMRHASCRTSGTSPTLASWLNRLDAALASGTRPAILICHSLSCYARRPLGGARASLAASRPRCLVAPSDLERPDAPACDARFPADAAAEVSGADAGRRVHGRYFCQTGARPRICRKLGRGLLRIAGARAHQQRIAARYLAAGPAVAWPADRADRGLTCRPLPRSLSSTPASAA